MDRRDTRSVVVESSRTTGEGRRSPATSGINEIKTEHAARYAPLIINHAFLGRPYLIRNSRTKDDSITIVLLQYEKLVLVEQKKVGDSPEIGV